MFYVGLALCYLQSEIKIERLMIIIIIIDLVFKAYVNGYDNNVIA